MKAIYKIIYNPFLNKIILKFNRLISNVFSEAIKLNPSGKFKFNFNQDNFIIINTNQTSHLTYLLYWKGIESFEYSSIFLKLIHKVDTFYDIGSNIGYYSLLAGKANPVIHVEAFEPSPGVLIYLQNNIKDNDLASKIRCNSIALSNEKGVLNFNEIYNPKYPNIPNLSGEHNLETKSISSKKITVSSDTLDNFFKDNSTRLVDLIKIDTEGTEDLILKNASHLIIECKPIIICETLFNKIEKELEEIMISYGYEFYNHIGSHLQKVNSIQRNIDDGVRNCFFVHPTKRYLIGEFIDPKT